MKLNVGSFDNFIGMKEGVFDPTIQELRQQYETKLDRLRELQTKLDKIKAAKYDQHEKLRTSVYDESKNLIHKVRNVDITFIKVFKLVF